jgi:hypothetical protein
MVITKTYKNNIDDNAVVVEVEVKQIPDDEFSIGVGLFFISIILVIILMALTLSSIERMGFQYLLLYLLIFLPSIGLIVVARYRRGHPKPSSYYRRILTFDKHQRTIRVEKGPLRGESREFDNRKYRVKVYPVEKLNSINMEAIGLTHRVYVGVGWAEYCVYAGKDADRAAVLHREISRLRCLA